MVNFWNNGPGAGGLGTALGVEAIAEFQTLTNTYTAQFGGAGAVDDRLECELGMKEPQRSIALVTFRDEILA